MKTSEQVTLNKKQRLFVIAECGGYTCLGFDVCRNRIGKLAHELGESHTTRHDRRYSNLLEMYAEYERLTALAYTKHNQTGWRSSSELTPALIGLEGRRVEVVHRWESGAVETVRFQVGKSSGWIPCHLALARRNVSGGPAVCLGRIETVRVIR